ncbi:TetR/AcrR family transcriptional regulator [Streptomyces nanshensis]|uniref:TetR/AcrR family transcriptional regulator n=1 Tax=Streptomyces nanshensis TaxID=518642 RepID=UPI00085C3BAE|nr:TetR/AcrR family transcriptional regulator C-terminal domain-containing protein [Streptomyces nanshensis]
MSGSPNSRTGTRQRRQWGSLGRDEIVGAALHIARTDGLHALTIRRLAADLGASRMALYRHVADKDALIDLVMNAVAEHSMLPPPTQDGTWQERLRRLAESIRGELRTYPGLTDILMTRANQGPGALRCVETILELLAEAGLKTEEAARYYLLFIDLVFGRVHRELHGDPVGPQRTAQLFAAAEATPELSLTRLGNAESVLRSVTGEQIFHAELDMLVDAVEAAAR